jgi:hypothetical protein
MAWTECLMVLCYVFHNCVYLWTHVGSISCPCDENLESEQLSKNWLSYSGHNDLLKTLLICIVRVQ